MKEVRAKGRLTWERKKAKWGIETLEREERKVRMGRCMSLTFPINYQRKLAIWQDWYQWFTNPVASNIHRETHQWSHFNTVGWVVEVS